MYTQQKGQAEHAEKLVSNVNKQVQLYKSGASNKQIEKILVAVHAKNGKSWTRQIKTQFECE